MIYLSLALAPVFALVLYIYYRDKHDREPLGMLLRSFIAGIISIIPAAIIEYKFGIEDKNSLMTTAYATFLVIAGAEEVSKYVFMRRIAYHHKAFNEPFDGIVYCVMVSMGFAAAENVMYVFQSEDPMNTAIMRMFTAVPAHFTFAVIMGYYIGLAKYNPIRGLEYTLKGIFGAMFFHGLYDFCLIQQVFPFIAAGAVVSLLLAIRLSYKAMRMQSENSKNFMENEQPNIE
jgi:RsiW-degrading membrane proteinase PrsW (M82 family)